MKIDLEKTLIRHEKALPFFLLLVYLFFTIPGITWGAPSLWNPDELYWRVNKALLGEMVFDETEPDYNYPSLPKYAMFGVSWIVRELGGTEIDMLVAARLISVALGGITVLMVYFLAKSLSKNIYIHLLTAFLMLSNVILIHNARFAHNDLYLLFFITLALVSLIKYRNTGFRLWIYLAFFAIGCATSSKYTGASFFLVASLIFVVTHWNKILKNWLQTLEVVTLNIVFAALGYFVGTPKALFWMAHYLKRMVPTALRNASYGRSPGDLPGIVGQWGVFQNGLGTGVFYLFMVAFVWHVGYLVYYRIRKPEEKEQKRKTIFVIISSIVIFNVPFWFSYNYQSRFFLPFVPMLSVLAGLFIEDIIQFLKSRGYRSVIPLINIGIALIIISSLASVISVVLLFKNDARIAAGKYIETLKEKSHIEYTLYPPQVEESKFEIARNYPIYFIKYEGEQVPTNKPYKYNIGEEGLYLRGADYLVIDSFTYARFSNEYICATNSVECDFFSQLLAGETDLNLLATFEYSLPSYLPQISLGFVNPIIKVFEIPQ